MPALDAVLFQLAEKRVEALAGLRRDRHHRIKVIQRGVAEDRLHQFFLFVRQCIDLVQREDRGHIGSFELFDQRQLTFFDLILAVDDQNRDVAALYGLVDRLDHVFTQLRARLVQTRCVDKDQLIVALGQDPRDPCAGRLRL